MKALQEVLKADSYELLLALRECNENDLIRLRSNISAALGSMPKKAGLPTVIVSLRPRNLLDAIRDWRVALGTGLRETKDFIEAGRYTANSREQAEQLANSIIKNGGEAVII